MQFVELHARSAFSFLEGASVPEALAYACAKQQLPAMAVLDRNGLYGSPRFHLIAKSKGIKSHVGAELSVGGPWRRNRPTTRCWLKAASDIRTSAV